VKELVVSVTVPERLTGAGRAVGIALGELVGVLVEALGLA
jgi:hypothetical protein